MLKGHLFHLILKTYIFLLDFLAVVTCDQVTMYLLFPTWIFEIVF